jgi:ketosteroid isomerase-like protein
VNAGSAADRSDPDVDIVLKSYQAYARGDIDAAVSPLHPEVEWIEPDEFPNGGRHDGSAAMSMSGSERLRPLTPHPTSGSTDSPAAP